MMLNIQHLLLLGMLSASLHWVLARAEITRFAWSRAPRWLDKLLRCPACSGWWLGVLFGVLGVCPVQIAESRAGEFACAGLLAIWLTPVFETCLLWGLEHSAVPEAESTQVPANGGRPDCWSCGLALLGNVAVPGGTCVDCGAVQGSVCVSPVCGNAAFLHTHKP